MLSLTAAALWDSFSARAELLGAAVMRAPSPEFAVDLVGQTAPSFGWTTSVARSYPRIAAGGTPTSRPALAERAADGGEAPLAEVVAVGAFAVAETGSVAVDEPAADRGACFLAERLWLLVPEAEIVPTLDAGIARIRQLVLTGAHHPLLMSGPSRTADIERVLTVGVHGPRALTIVIVGDA